MNDLKFKLTVLKQKWLNTILHLSSVIYRKKIQTFSSGLIKNLWLIIEVIGLELVVSVISLPFYFFITPNKAFSQNEKQIRAYRLRQKITLAALLAFLLYYFIHFLLITWGILSLPKSCDAALSVNMTVSGSYTGNGIDNRAITGLCFQPDVVMIKSTTTDYEVIRTTSMVGDASKQLNSPTTGLEVNIIQSLDSDGFTLGTDNRVNRLNSTYEWVAFKGVPGNMKVGTFTGNGSSNHVITGVGFQPDFVMLVPANASSATMRSSAMTNGKSYYLSNADSGFTNGLNSFNTDGFTVSSYQMNSSGTVYHYIAWKKINGRMNVGSYTGNGTDNRNITGVGFQPEYMLIRGDGYYQSQQSMASLSGDNSITFENVAPSGNKIQQRQTDGFQVGTDSTVNSNGISYFWVAFTRSVPPAFTQSGYRFYTNQDSLTPASPLTAANTSASLSGVGDAFRLRVLMHVSNDQLVQNGETFKLQYVEKGTGTCSSPGGSNPTNYTDITNSTLIAYKNNTSVADGAFIAPDTNDPTNGSYTVSPQSYEEANNFTNSQSALTVNTDGEWDFALYDNGAPENTSYCFRIVRSDSSAVLDTYSVYPQITTAIADHTAPTISNVTSSTANGAYTIGSTISIQVAFDEAVNVTGTPQLLLETGTTDAIANYSGGSETNTLTFTYLVGVGENSSNLDYQNTNALSLNGGTIRDASSNDSTLTLPFPSQSGSLSANKDIIIDTTTPTVLDVTSSNANAMYHIGNTVNIQIQLSETVNVSGNPTLMLETGTSDTIATYTSGSGTDTLTFTYTVAPGENSEDLDYASTDSLFLGGGTVKDAANNDATLTLPIPGAAGSLGANKNIIINTDVTAPTVANVTSTKENGTYSVAEAIPVIIEWDENVIVTGTPSLTLETGDHDAVATYTSGSGTNNLTFTYTVSSGEFATDLDYTNINALSLAGGTIQDIAGNNATLTLPVPGIGSSLGINKDIIIDTTPPDITAPTVMNITSPTTNGSYKAGDLIEVQVDMSENVIVSGAPRLLLATGTPNTYAIYNHGSGSSVLVFDYTIGAGQNSVDLDYVGINSLDINGGTIRDAANNSLDITLPSSGEPGSLSANKDIIVDTTTPLILNVTSPQTDGTYGVGVNILIRIQFSEIVEVTGTPQLQLETGTDDASVNYTDGSGSDTLTFSYTVAAGQNSPDLDYTDTAALNLNTGTIRDIAGNNATLTLSTPAANGSLGNNKNFVIDTRDPTITNITSSTADGTYKIGDDIDITIEFDEPVSVSGIPQLQLETGTNDKIVNYTSGSGTSSLNFHYTIASGESTSDLDYTNANALALNSGTIQDSVVNNASLTLPLPGTAGSLGANKNIIVDGIAPSAVTLTLSEPTSSSITIRWIAPGDDGANGTASYYALRYSITPITAENYESATPAEYETTPQPAGTQEQAVIHNLSSSTTYYFALKTEDDAENISEISNVPSLTTLAIVTPPEPPVIPPTSPNPPTALSRNGSSGGTGSSGVIFTKPPIKPDPSTQQTSEQIESIQIFSFADMANHWAKKYAQDLHDECHVTGYASANTSQKPFFKPDNPITRAELMTMIIKCKYGILITPNVQTFADVPLNHWAAPYIQKAAQDGIIDLNKNFRPNDPVLLSEALKIILLTQFDKTVLQKSGSPLECIDIKASDWFAHYFGYAVKNGIIIRYKNTNGLCQPFSHITRAETAKILMLNHF